MNALLSNQKHKLFLALILIALPPVASGLSSDKNQPIEVEADTAELDDRKNRSIYTGNVIVTQGSIRMTGDKMTVYHTEEDELDTLIMEGDPATYRQLPDNSDVYDEAEARTIEYYELQNLIILIENAEVRQESMTMSGDRIDYDTELSQVKAQSKTPATTDTKTPKDKERVKVILKKKKETDAGPEDEEPDQDP